MTGIRKKETEEEYLKRVATAQRRLGVLKKMNPYLVFWEGMPNCIEVKLDGYYNAEELRSLADALEPKE